jgi:hypothetical protein
MYSPKLISEKKQKCGGIKKETRQVKMGLLNFVYSTKVSI